MKETILATQEQTNKPIEFAEYMAKAAEQYMTAVADYWDLGDALTESMMDDLKDKTVALQRSIYEFRKRSKPTAK